MLWADSNRQLARWWWIHLHKVTKSEKSTRGPALKWVEWCRNTSVDSQHCGASIIVQWSSGCEICGLNTAVFDKMSVNFDFILLVHAHTPFAYQAYLQSTIELQNSKWLSSHHLVSHICMVTHICLSQSCPLLQCCCPNFPPFLRYFLQTNRAQL